MPGFKRNSRTRRREKVIRDSKTWIVIAIICSIIIFVCIVSISSKQRMRDLEIAQKEKEFEALIYDLFSTSDDIEIENVENEEIEIPNTVINITSIGDIICETELYQSAFNKAENKYNFENMFESLRKHTINADLTLATIETNFVDGESYSGRIKYNAPVEVMDTMKSLGIDIVNTATNHSLDYGYRGVESTIDMLNNEGMTNVGTYKTEEDRDTVYIRDVSGIKIAFLSYTYGITSKESNFEGKPYILNLFNKDKILQDINKAKEEADFIIAFAHWGDVESSVQNNEQEEIANFMLDNGVDFILGTHPASIQPLDVKQNNDGKNVFVAYSLGNVTSSRAYKNSFIEMVLNIEITKESSTGNVKVTKVSYEPIYLLDRGKNSENRFKVLDVKQTIQNYENGNEEGITQKQYENILDSLIKIANLIGENR